MGHALQCVFLTLPSLLGGNCVRPPGWFEKLAVGVGDLESAALQRECYGLDPKPWAA